MIDERAIEDAARVLAENASSPARIYLFGSRARGTEKDDSDLDFLVIERRVESKVAEMAKLRDSLPPLGVPVDVIVISEEEARRRSEIPGSLVETALKEGRVLVG